jgi:VanZ family protein
MKAFRAAPRLGFCALVLTISVGSLLPQQDSVPLGHLDKLAHVGAYALTAFVGALGAPSRRGWWVVASAMLGLGVLMELLQSYVPGRSASVGDLVADVVGLTAGIWLAAAFLRVLGRVGLRPFGEAD